MQTVGALIEVVGNDFARYMDTFNPFLCSALKNYQESSVSFQLNFTRKKHFPQFIGYFICRRRCYRHLSSNAPAFGEIFHGINGVTLYGIAQS